MKNAALNSKNLQETVHKFAAENSELKDKITVLTKQTSTQQDTIHTQNNKISELERLIKWYEERLRLNAQKKYGASSEQSNGEYVQLGFFDEAEATSDPKAPEPTVEEITYKRKKQVGKREEDFSKLPVETVIHELPEGERTCPDCGKELHAMGKEVRKELTVIPAKVVVTEHIREVYACRNCEKTGTTVPVIKAPMPEPVIKNSAASPSAVAHIMTQKYVTYTPLYRQEQEFERQGIALSRQTMANWMIKASQDWLEPLYDRMKSVLLNSEVLHADETTLQVLKEPGRKARSESYMWLYRTSGDTDKHIALYEYQETRSSSHPKRFLEGWKGYLHTDGYAGYHVLNNATVVGCWAHVRRRFDEALKGLSEEERSGSKVAIGLNFCNKLFMLEREWLDLDPIERLKRRVEKSKPVAEAFFAWAKALNALPKSLLGKAVSYALSQREYLMNVYLDGRLELSNNRAERSIKPFVMGRKNWLFSCTPKGAKASAVIYSVIETAKENGLKPFDYLKFLLETIPNSTTAQLDTLLPWSPTIPNSCHASP